MEQRRAKTYEGGIENESGESRLYGVIDGNICHYRPKQLSYTPLFFLHDGSSFHDHATNVFTPRYDAMMLTIITS